MTYTEFYNFFKDYFTAGQIAGLQKIAFQEHKDAHGFYPQRREQKQFAYGFLYDFLYNNIADADECYEYLKSAGVTKEQVKKFWCNAWVM